MNALEKILTQILNRWKTKHLDGDQNSGLINAPDSSILFNDSSLYRYVIDLLMKRMGKTMPVEEP